MTREHLRAAAAAALASATLMAVALTLGLGLGRPLRFSLTDSEADALEGLLFGEGIGARPRWTRAQALIELPVRVRGASLVVTASRPGREPATLVLRQDGREIGRVLIGPAPYTFKALLLEGEPRVSVQVDSPEPRYGALLHELAVEGDGAFWSWPSLRLAAAAALAGLLIGLGFSLSGLGPRGAVLGTLAVAALPLGVLAALDPLAAVILVPRAGLVAGVLMAPLGVAVARLWPAATLVPMLVLAAGLSLRAGLVFHPSYDYQDVEIHQRLVRAIQRDGAWTVWSGIGGYQQRLDLGRARVGGRFRPYPYPPTFHTLVAAFPARLTVGAMKAVALLAQMATVLLVMILAGRLGADARAAGFLAAVMPQDVLELLRASYPAILGHLLDTALMVALVHRFDRVPRASGVLAFGAAMGACALTYNASPVHYALFVPLALFFLSARPRLPGRRGLALAALVGALFAWPFYGGYVRETLGRLRASAAAASAATVEGLPIGTDELGWPLILSAAVGLAGARHRIWPAAEGRLALAWCAYIAAITVVVLAFPDPFFYFRPCYFAHPILLVMAAAVGVRWRWLTALSCLLIGAWSLERLLTFVEPFFVTYTGSLAH